MSNPELVPTLPKAPLFAAVTGLRLPEDIAEPSFIERLSLARPFLSIALQHLEASLFDQHSSRMASTRELTIIRGFFVVGGQLIEEGYEQSERPVPFEGIVIDKEIVIPALEPEELGTYVGITRHDYPDLLEVAETWAPGNVPGYSAGLPGHLDAAQTATSTAYVMFKRAELRD